MLSADASIRSLYKSPFGHHCALPSSSCMITERSQVTPCSFWKRESTANVPSTPWPLPPSVAWPSSRMKSSPFLAACTAQARPENPPPTMTMSVGMTSITSSGFTSMPEQLMVSCFADAPPAPASVVFCGAQPARPHTAAPAAPRAPRVTKFLRDISFMIVLLHV